MNTIAMKHILIVDDNVTNLKMVQTVLKDKYKVTLLTSGAQALRFLKKQTPDMMLLDVRMPDMDGFETLAAIRALPQGATIPAIFLTADNTFTSIGKALSMGAVNFLVKPLVPEDLLRCLQEHLQ